ncbi:MAG TPA: hypothetical protein VIQ77_14595 [Mucilaginibacter sp.]|jgi:hypothetical protein
MKNSKLRDYILVLSFALLAYGLLGLEFLFDDWRIEEQSILRSIFIIVYIAICYFILQWIRKATRNNSIKSKIDLIDKGKGESINLAVSNLNEITYSLKETPSELDERKEGLIKSLMELDKEKLIDYAVFAWGNYGYAINKNFGLSDFVIHTYNVSEMFQSCSKRDIISFTIYVNEKITELDNK